MCVVRRLLCRRGNIVNRSGLDSHVWGLCGRRDQGLSELERSHMKMLKDIYLGKINLVSQLLRIRSWEGAKSILRLFAWEDNFNGESEMQAIWEEAVWGDNGKRLRTKHLDYTVALRPGEMGVTT